MSTSKEELIRRGIPLHDIQHNQHRRAIWHDYGGRGLYMVTLCIDGRHPLFGHLEGNIKASRDSADFPHIVLSRLGRIVLNVELPKIHRSYPQIELWKVAIMPDHIHLLIYVAQPLPEGEKLGNIIGRFKGGCTRAWWAERNTALEGAGTTSGAEMAKGKEIAAVAALSSAADRSSLFEASYHDRIIKRPGMLENIKRYMSDNPLRALMRRQLPKLMERCMHLRIGDHEYAAFGALFLLKRAEKEQVFYHRRDKELGMATELTEKFQQAYERQLTDAREGVVLVSPAISRGEKIVIDAAIDEGLPVIHLQKEEIGKYWKPERKRFEACARGSLLILAPWRLDEEIGRGEKTALESAGTTATAGTTTDYARFHRLNDLAEEICNTTDAVLLDIGAIR